MCVGGRVAGFKGKQKGLQVCFCPGLPGVRFPGHVGLTQMGGSRGDAKVWSYLVLVSDSWSLN